MATKAATYDRLTPEQKAALATPAAFARFHLKQEPVATQEKVMNACARNGARVAFRCCNEGGKTSHVVAPLILWWLAVFPKGQVVSTAGAWRQVKSQLIPKLKSFAGKFPHWEFNDTGIKRPNPDGQMVEGYIGFSTNDAGKFEGYHGSLDAPLLIIVDEAKTVTDDIYEAVDRCNPQSLLIASSPGNAEGEFYRAFGTRAAFYDRFKMEAKECPWIDPSTIEKRIAKWGMDHPLVRSMIFAEFMDYVEGGLLTLAQFEKCIENPPQFKSGRRHAFCDFAGGGDENCLGLEHGNRVRIEKAWRDKDVMAAVGQFVTLFKKLHHEIGLEASEIEGDADGQYGHDMVQAIREAGWPILEFHGGHEPLTEPDYFNRISEVWGQGTNLIKRCERIIENDDELRAQLIDRKSKFHSKGKIWLESKEDMRKRGRSSPDRADAILGAMGPLPRVESFSIAPKSGHDEWGEAYEPDRGVLAGMEC